MSAARVLIVGDELAFASALASQVQDLGYTPALAVSGQEAIEQVEQLRPDLVVMDIRLAGELDGLQAANEIRSRLDVPIVFVTGDPDSVLDERAQIADPFGYLAKPFDRYDVQRTIEMALYKHAAERKLKRRLVQLALLNDISSQIVAPLDLDQVLHRAAMLVQQRFGFHHVAVFTLSQDRRELIMTARSGSLAGAYPADHRLGLDQGIVGWVAKHGRARLANDVAAEPIYINLYPTRVKTQSELAVPIKIGDKLLGVLDVQSPAPGAFDEDDVMLIETVADQMAVTIENARLYSSLRRERDRAQQYLDTAAVILVALNREGEITLLNRKGHALLGYPEGELLGKNWFDVCVPAEISQVVRAVFQQLMAGSMQPSEYFENPVVTRTGEQRIIAWYNRLLTDELGRVTGTFSSGQDVTERQVAEAALAHRLALEDLVAQLSSRLITVPPAGVDEAVAAALQAVGELAGVDRCYLVLFDDDVTVVRDVHEWHAADVVPRAVGMRGAAVERFPWITGKLKRMETIHVRSVADLGPEALVEQATWRMHALRSLLALPLARGESLVGFLGLSAERTEKQWGEDDIRLLRVVGEAFANVLERKRADAALRHRTEQLEALRHVGMEIASQLGLETLLHSIVSEALGLLGGRAGGCYLYRPDLDVLEWAVAVGPETAPIGTLLHRGEGLSGKVWVAGHPMFVEDYRAWEGRATAFEELPFGAVVAAPIYCGDEFMGVVDVLAPPGRTFSAEDAELLSLFAAQAAIAIANARLFEAEQRRREEAEALRRASLALGSTLDVDRVLDRVLEQVAQVIPYDSATVLWIEEGVARVIQQRGYERAGTAEATAGLRLIVADTPNLYRMFRTRSPHIVSDVAADPGWVRLEATAWIQSWAGAPIVVQDEVLGFFSLDSRTPGFYTADHGDLLAALTAHAAIAIENARLYANLRQRMDELLSTQAQLVQSAKLAAVGELAAGVAHELNNPLTAVLGFAELVMWNMAEDEPLRADVSTIASEARRARDIIQGLLDFSRQSESFSRETDLHQVVRETLALVRRQIGNRHVALEEDYASDMPPALLVPGRIKQVVLNLVTNALHAMPNGGRLAIRTRRVGSQAALSVTDTGTGIDPESLPHIFEPFFTTKPPNQGTGLGLSVSLGIVQEHGGQITVDTHVGDGSTFTIWLPLATNTEEAEDDG